jgi:hypothetical protein
MSRYDSLAFVPVALVVAFVMVYAVVRQPGYTDAYYYVNAANRLVRGDGLTDAYLWTYIGAPDALPAPSHTYWMPMASLLAAAGMALFDAPGAYWAAQVPYALLLVLLGYTAFWLGARLGGTRRQAWAAGLIVLFGGFFARFWGVIETFTPFAVFGAGCLIALGRGLSSGRWGWFALAGALAAGAHLTRADGVLLVLAGAAAVVFVRLFGAVGANTVWHAKPLRDIVILLVAYLVVMSPWMVRNLIATGAPLPVGGAQGIWFTSYNDLFSYPPDASPAHFFEVGGWRLLLESRWLGFSGAVVTLIAVEGLIFLAPLMLIGLFRRWREPFLIPFWIYALGLHLAMSLVFPFPGYRGGLFHSAAALFPFWVALGLVGLDDVIDQMARWRGWNAPQAKQFFTAFAVLLALGPTFYVLRGAAQPSAPAFYDQMAAVLPDEARVMINDPAQMYYHTGREGVVLPNEAPDVIPEIAARYDVDYLLFERVQDGVSLAAPAPLMTVPGQPPDFLTPIPLDDPNVRLYAIDPDATAE